jgi:hypothetical protein
MIAPLVLAGVGISTAIPASQSVVLNAVRSEAIGKASGTQSMMRQLGGALGLAIAVAVFSGAGSYASPGAFSDGFAPAIAVSAALSLIGALTAMTLSPGPRETAAAAALRQPGPIPAFETEGAHT